MFLISVGPQLITGNSKPFTFKTLLNAVLLGLLFGCTFPESCAGPSGVDSDADDDSPSPVDDVAEDLGADVDALSATTGADVGDVGDVADVAAAGSESSADVVAAAGAGAAAGSACADVAGTDDAGAESLVDADGAPVVAGADEDFFFFFFFFFCVAVVVDVAGADAVVAD